MAPPAALKTPPAPKLAFSYVRFSSPKQAEGDSYRRQQQTKEYCRQKGFALDTSLTLEDLGISSYTGRNLEHGCLGKFIQACESGLVPRGSALVVEHLDRLSRQRPRRTVALMTRLLDDFGIEIHMTQIGKVFLPEGSAEDETMDLMLAVMFAAKAHAESLDKSKRLRAMWDDKRRRAAETGEFLRQDLPWYLTTETGPDGKKRIVAPQDRAEVVRQVYKLTAKGFSSAEIARRFNAATPPVPTWRKQAKWTSARVRDLVRKPGPEGTLAATDKTKRIGRAYEIPNYYPRLVSPKLAKAARATLIRNKRGGSGRPFTAGTDGQLQNIFRGLLRFKNYWCRGQAVDNGSKNKNGKAGFHIYYQPMDADRPIRGANFSGRQIEPVIVAALSELRPEDLAAPRHPRRIDRTAPLRAAIADLTAKQANLVGAIETGSTASTALIQRLAAVDAELEEKKAELNTLAAVQATPPPDPTPLRAQGDLYDPEYRQRLGAALRRIVSTIWIGKTLADLPLPPRFLLRYAQNRSAILKEARVLPDPGPDDRRGAIPDLAVLVEFANGALRLINRGPSGIITYRIEPDQLRGAEKQTKTNK